MFKFAKITLSFSIVFLILALLIKFTPACNYMKALVPVNWIKLTDTFLLLTIALLLFKEKVNR